MERVMHIPGVAETKKNVEINRARLGSSTVGIIAISSACKTVMV